MLDVIHVLYEEDITPRTEFDIEVKDKIRGQLYPVLYNRPYNFATKKSTPNTRGAGWEPELESPVGSQQAVKPYIPPTPIEDLPGILDAPLH
jgi:hypothetical protein